MPFKWQHLAEIGLWVGPTLFIALISCGWQSSANSIGVSSDDSAAPIPYLPHISKSDVRSRFEETWDFFYFREEMIDGKAITTGDSRWGNSFLELKGGETAIENATLVVDFDHLMTNPLMVVSFLFTLVPDYDCDMRMLYKALEPGARLVHKTTCRSADINFHRGHIPDGDVLWLNIEAR
ncbi:MAG: hypothetical protein OXC95_04075 [Dehalococcoidia bacterium]|nr:hypothetical protein [Dehalococcoidia bacterium]